MRTLFRLTALLASFWAGAAAAQTAAGSGTVFTDCPQCPQMVVIPPGSFQMGEIGHSRETPVHTVTIAKPFAMSVNLITFDDFDACVADGGCGLTRLDDNGWGRGRRPAINVTWDQAASYAVWLSRKTGKSYRLPSEAEWEYGARAGTTTAFWFGDSVPPSAANCDGCGSQFDNKQTSPVGTFKPNAFGLYDMVGNLTEWVADPWHDNYDDAPADGSVWDSGSTKRMTMRGGSWFNPPARNHAAFRNGDSPRVHNAKIGFRVVEILQNGIETIPAGSRYPIKTRGVPGPRQASPRLNLGSQSVGSMHVCDRSHPAAAASGT